MFQAENVISFPRDASTTDLLRDFIGSPEQRLDEIVARLGGVDAILFFLRNFDGEYAKKTMDAALMGLECLVHDCITIAELRPVQELRA